MILRVEQERMTILRNVGAITVPIVLAIMAVSFRAPHDGFARATFHAGVLSAVERARFDKDGFLVLREVLPRETTDELLRELEQLATSFDPEAQRSVFTTDDQQRVSDEYFLNSGHEVRYFLEKDALDANGKLVVDKMRALNKIGHALHDRNPTFRKFAYSPLMKNLVRSLGFSRPQIVQSMAIFKHPKIGGEVNAHRDSWFLLSRPATVKGIWVALEDATIENGCLWAVPGSHGDPLTYRMIRNKHGNATEFSGHDAHTYDESRFAPLPVPRGSIVLLHGSNVHKSAPNLSRKSRVAVTLHVIESEDTVWPEDNWLQRPPEFPFRDMFTEEP